MACGESEDDPMQYDQQRQYLTLVSPLWRDTVICDSRLWTSVVIKYDTTVVQVKEMTRYARRRSVHIHITTGINEVHAALFLEQFKALALPLSVLAMQSNHISMTSNTFRSSLRIMRWLSDCLTAHVARLDLVLTGEIVVGRNSKLPFPLLPCSLLKRMVIQYSFVHKPSTPLMTSLTHLYFGPLDMDVGEMGVPWSHVRDMLQECLQLTHLTLDRVECRDMRFALDEDNYECAIPRLKHLWVICDDMASGYMMLALQLPVIEYLRFQSSIYSSYFLGGFLMNGFSSAADRIITLELSARNLPHSYLLEEIIESFSNLQVLDLRGCTKNIVTALSGLRARDPAPLCPDLRIIYVSFRMKRKHMRRTLCRRHAGHFAPECTIAIDAPDDRGPRLRSGFIGTGNNRLLKTQYEEPQVSGLDWYLG
ncbi:hypothetical protein R3P38DRAFT_2797519 [Favolaschia claudopus]|uniref:F-box domain-containing protein n=1 Tax=Favolaschia claudopus TaxID=2862362 RepID=A0AAW0A377_9AGAR